MTLQYTIAQLKAITEKIDTHIYSIIGDLIVTAWVTPEPVTFEARMTGTRKSLIIGEKWGELWDCAWFHFSGEIPKETLGKAIVLLIDINGEACLVDEAGTPIQGLTNINSDYDFSLGKPGKRIVHLLDHSVGGELIDFWADAGCNDLFGRYQGHGKLREAYVAVCNETLRDLYYDFEVLLELMQQLPETSARSKCIYSVLCDAAELLQEFNEVEARQAREILAPELNKKGGDPSLLVSAIGHAHIDLAWLWPIRETKRKGARTFATALQLMERYPEYVFGASQPQLYQWVKENYPLLYRKITEKIKEGRWEPQGAMWVEADTNLSGGEALVRQILYGKRFFRDEFGVDIQVLWLPDVFGYSGALPQILKQSGVEYFMTIKLSWNTVNRFPHHTFLWQGIDGTKVLAHMPPEGTYNSSAAPRAIIKAEQEYLEKGISNECLMLFGIGDGGGGAGEEHLERLKREKDLQGLSPVFQEPAIDFFKRLATKSQRYPTWKGELYLEKHQGTYTTQARNKRFNRKLEIALRELELTAVLMMMTLGNPYPQNELEQIWKETLLYQFHDILPGSSIKRVYDETLARYAFLLEYTTKLIQQNRSLIVNAINTSDFHKPVVVFNSLSWERQEWMAIAGQWIKLKVPSLGYITIVAPAVCENIQNQPVTPNVLENEQYLIQFAATGAIQSIYDKENRHQVLMLGAHGNVLEIYDDPGDAWDFDSNYETKKLGCFTLQSTKVLVEGPMIALEHVYIYGASKLSQKVVLIEGSRRIDFITWVDWQESHKMLRTSFPLNVVADNATCEIQFGNIERPTHRNTSWEIAKYEISAHKWVDISQPDYGVALLNDCKYGYKVKENMIDLNILRSPDHPGQGADQAEHQLTYSLYPHPGDYIVGKVVRAAYELNMPLSAVPVNIQSGKLPSQSSLIEVNAENVIIEAVKKAEDSEAIIIRFYECHGASAQAKIILHFDYQSVVPVNLLEEQIETPKFNPATMELHFGPFEIHTLKVII